MRPSQPGRQPECETVRGELCRRHVAFTTAERDETDRGGTLHGGRRDRDARPDAFEPAHEAAQSRGVAHARRGEDRERADETERRADQHARERTAREQRARERDPCGRRGHDRQEREPELRAEPGAVDPPAVGGEPVLVDLTPRAGHTHPRVDRDAGHGQRGDDDDRARAARPGVDRRSRAHLRGTRPRPSTPTTYAETVTQ